MRADELVDLVDERGEVGRPGVTRREVKEHKDDLIASGLYQPIVIVVVLDAEGRVIAQVRGAAKGDDGGGEIDHVCGVVSSGESWEQAARREAREEIGVELRDLQMVLRGVNVYQRYRWLAVARAQGAPHVVDSTEVSRILALPAADLKRLASDGMSFVKGFFDDMDLVLERCQ